MTAILSIRLGFHEVGLLRLIEGTARFAQSDEHRRSFPRPTLGQVFLDDESREHVGKAGRVPNWFGHLLPEGALRTTAERQVYRRGRRHELHLLVRLGTELPGAVRVVPVVYDDELEEDDEGPTDEPEDDPAAPQIRFSLAGVQPKFSVVNRAGGGLTLATETEQGSRILKVPDPARPALAAAELAGMRWAGASGIEVPAVELCETSRCAELPPELIRASPNSLLVERFDRDGEGQRIHIEDFAQVLDRPTEEGAKYAGATFEQIARLVSGITGEIADLEQLVRRVAFMVVLGNEDMHLKNLSLIYRDGRNARLSPAYDLVPTRAFLESDGFALKLGGSRAWRDVRLASFDGLAGHLGATRADVEAWVVDTVRRAGEAFDGADSSTLPLADAQRERLAEHRRSVPLLKMLA